jgi:hypothetical protein
MAYRQRFSKGLGSLSYIDKGGGAEPLLILNKPEKIDCTMYYVAPRVLNKCKAYY